MCVSIGVRVATITTRSMPLALPIQERFSPTFRLVFLFLLSRRNSAGFRLCASARLRLCASAPLHLCASVLLSSQCCSGLSTTLVAHLLSSLFCSSLCCGLLALCSAFDSALHSPLLLTSALHLCLLSSRPHSSRGPLHKYKKCANRYGLLQEILI